MTDDFDDDTPSEDDLDLDHAITVEADDGGVEITFGGDDQDDAADPMDKFGDNLAETLSEIELARISDDLLEAIEDDDSSRSEWLAQREYGLGLLGLDPRKSDGDQDGTSTSTIVHPLLLEAVLRFQANAKGELLPVDGPAKVRDDTIQDNSATAVQPQAPASPVQPPAPSSDDLADALEDELNHYLTTVATEFYPDMDRMLFGVGFGGCGFKKLYHCPLRNRPVSEMVDAKDLIVQNNPVDLANARRITHVIKMSTSTLKRMQIIGNYAETAIDIGDPDDDEANAVDQRLSSLQGKSEDSYKPQDRERTIYECYCELDIEGHEHKDDEDKVTGLELPYKVTIDKSSKQILEIRRNWRDDGSDDDKTPFPVAKRVFVKYTYVQGLGFYGIGLLHILGNAVRSATMGWRILLDAGMRSNYGGGFVQKMGERQNSLQMSGRPGEFIPIQTNGKDISEMVMPFPFKGPDQAMMALVQDVVQTAERVGGTAETNVGEGRQDAPVGTTMALLEAQRVVVNGVHKGLYQSLKDELQILVELFREDPEALWRGNPKPVTQWTRDLVLQALEDNDIVPQADPNTSSHLQRLGRGQALMQLVTAAPGAFDLVEVQKYMVRDLNIPNWQRFISQTPQFGPQPDPTKMAQMQQDQQLNQAKMALEQQKQQANQTIAALKHDLEQFKAGTQRAGVVGKLKVDGDRNHADAMQNQVPDQQSGLTGLDIYDAQTRRIDAETRKQGLAAKVHDTLVDAQQQSADRQSENDIAALNARKEIAIHNSNQVDKHIARQTEETADQLDRDHQMAMMKAKPKPKPGGNS